MQPIRVTARTVAPVVMPRAMHLDALLLYARARELDLPDPHSLDKAEDIPPLSIPLTRVSHAGASVWAASVAVEATEGHPAAVWISTKHDAEDWMWLDRPVQVNAGGRKHKMVRKDARCVDVLEWIAFGDLEAVRGLLRRVWGPEDAPMGAIGSMRALGAGEIAAWKAVEGDHTLTECFVRHEHSQRNLPAAWVTWADRWRIGSWRAPYWLRDHQERIPAPRARVQMTPEATTALAEAREVPCG